MQRFLANLSNLSVLWNTSNTHTNASTTTGNCVDKICNKLKKKTTNKQNKKVTDTGQWNRSIKVLCGCYWLKGMRHCYITSLGMTDSVPLQTSVWQWLAFSGIALALDTVQCMKKRRKEKTNKEKKRKKGNTREILFSTMTSCKMLSGEPLPVCANHSCQ